MPETLGMGFEGGELYLPTCKAVKKQLKSCFTEFAGGRGLKDQSAFEHSFVSMREGVGQADRKSVV